MAQENRVIAQEAFFYATPIIANLAAGATQQAFISIEANSDFIITQTTYYCQYAVPALTADARPLPPITVNIMDTGSAQRITRDPIFIDTMAGTGQLPYIWTRPRRFRANASIEVTFTNVSAGTAVTSLQLVFGGQKVYYG